MPETAVAPKPSLTQVDFSLNPFIVFWEVTRACALACRHCRADAQPRRHPRELTTAEGYDLIDQVADMGNPVLILTGGDPLMRPDLFLFIRHALGKGLRVSLAPSATRLVTREALKRLKKAGLARISFSLDGSTASVHDAFRGTPGSFQRTLECLRSAQETGLSLQVNTTVCRHNLQDLPAIAAMVAQLPAVTWDVFFLVPTGRGQAEDLISPEEHEALFHWLYDLSLQATFDIKTTAAQHYRRVVLQRQEQDGGSSTARATPGFHRSEDSIGRSSKGVNDGNGCVFVSHIGDIHPSGFLPLKVANIREQPLARVYRESPLFQALRDPARLKGKCGLCSYNRVCGGSRARAYALTGDPLAAEPCCIYQPEAWHGA